MLNSLKIYYAQLYFFLGDTRRRWKLMRMRQKITGAGCKCRDTIRLDEFFIRYNSAADVYAQYKDEFINGIYKFKSSKENPFVIDGGSNIGMSILCFKRQYPKCEILAFEPDPKIYEILQNNVKAAGISRVSTVCAGLGDSDGILKFRTDGASGGTVSEDGEIDVSIVSLSKYIDRFVDFLKLNIEGAELQVLKELERENRLINIDQMVVEYHGWANGTQLLGDILNLLRDNNFSYLVHDFDHETCGVTKPPFKKPDNQDWFCLIYAKNNRFPVP